MLEGVLPARLEEDVERLPVATAGLLHVVDAVHRRLDERNPSPYAQLHAAATHLVQHANLIVEAIGVVPRQAEGERADVQVLRSLDGCGEHDGRRDVDGKRRPLVLGRVPGIEAAAVSHLHKTHLVLNDVGDGPSRILNPVKHGEFKWGFRERGDCHNTTPQSRWGSSSFGQSVQNSRQYTTTASQPLPPQSHTDMMRQNHSRTLNWGHYEIRFLRGVFHAGRR